MAKLKMVKNTKTEEEEPTPKKKAAKAEKPSKSGRYTGKTTNMGVREYQNDSLIKNEKRKLTDAALAKEWRDEFPNAAAFDEKIVRGVRGLFNKGKHGNEIPKKPFHGYDPEGNPIPNRGEKKKTA